MHDNYGNEEVFEWLNGDKSSEPPQKQGRKTKADLLAEAMAAKELARQVRHEQQQVEAEWKSPVDDKTLAAWNDVANDFWFQGGE